MKHQCILHLGMPKTGTSSIQESLFTGLKDPRFLYFGFGMPNGSWGILRLFRDSYTHYVRNINFGLSNIQPGAYRKDLYRRLEKVICQGSAQGKTIIISAESAWSMNAGELLRFRRFMEDRSYSVKTITYLRPWKQWLESIFQQRVKAGGKVDFHDIQNGNFDLNYKNRIEMMEDVFGSDQVEIVKYDKSNLLDGCSVKDFCHRSGIRFAPDDIRRVNESIALPAVKLLYTYNKMGPVFYGHGAILSKNLLSHFAMARLVGPPLRFHSSVVKSAIDEVASQLPWLEKRLGIAFDEDIQRHDGSDCIREEADLFNYDRNTLEWLAMETGRPLTHNPAQVAECVHRLRRNPKIRDILKMASQNIGRETRRLKNRLQNNLRTSSN